jgi:hypothetical protein
VQHRKYRTTELEKGTKLGASSLSTSRSLSEI